MKFYLRALSGDLDAKSNVNYWLPDVSGSHFDFNNLIGKKVTIQDTGEKICRICGKKVEKLYQKGDCFTCFKTHPRCDICMIKPELCHYKEGTCRDEEFAKQWCLNNQLIYFSLTSGPKVGYLSMENYPQRWIDQGATKAIGVANAKSRLEAGEIETYLAQFMKDKTNWTAMLKGELLEDADLLALKKQWAKNIGERWPGRLSPDDTVIEINYPVREYPKKIRTVKFDSEGSFSGVLVGIRGQYLIFKEGVFSIKKFEGYLVDISSKEASILESSSQASLF